MNKPNNQTFILGNIVARVLLALMAAATGMAFLHDPNNGYGAIAAVFVWGVNAHAFACARQVAAYRAFQAEWKAADTAPGPRVISPAAKAKILMWAVGLPGWLLYGISASTTASQSGDTSGLVFFGTVSALVLGWLLLRYTWHRHPEPTGCAAPVTIAARAAKQSSGPVFNPSILPEHCQGLFEKDRNGGSK